MSMRNLYTHTTDIPASIGGEYNPSVETLRAAGWREDPGQPDLQDGYVRTSAAFVDDDGVNGKWIVVDRLATDVSAEAFAAEKADNLDRWINENAFLMLCQSQFGAPGKRGTKELLAKAFEIVQTDEKTAMKLFAVVIGIDTELKRMNGIRWWDDVVWHDDVDATAGAYELLGVTPA